MPAPPGRSRKRQPKRQPGPPRPPVHPFGNGFCLVQFLGRGYDEIAEPTIGAEQDTIRNIETVWGGAHGDTLTGDGLANRLEGNGGDDLLRGGAGDDALDGGSGFDTVNYSQAGGAVVAPLAGGAATVGSERIR